ncbi:Radixin [Taenia crassiceps]|uniref:Anaphase-promoting complex subunit 2 n=1 Tax=Taenia crassiceps TaxID=6207 RepID=A0ABR4Q5I1_9CEST
MSSASELHELVQSGLHVEYPSVFVDCALHHLRSICTPAFKELKADYPSATSIDPFEHAICMLSDHLPTFIRLFQWFHLVQVNTQSLYRLIAHHLPSSPHLSHFEVAVVGGLFTPDVYRTLEPYLYAYLLLELNTAEQATSRHNCFEDSPSTARLFARLSSAVTDLVEQCRGVFASEEFSLRFLLEDLVGPFAESAFLHKTRELVEGRYTKSFLEPLQDYVEHVMFKTWLPRVFPVTSFSESCPWSSQLVYTTFYSVRRSELFSIMMDYPDSHPTVMDLKAYLMETRALQDLIDTLSKEVDSRLLQPGVHTDEVLLAYGCLVRGLREIDPSSVAQDIVCRPVASCLRERDDAVRCIVDRLIAPPQLSATTDTTTDADVNVTDVAAADQITGLQRELLLPTPLEVEPTDEMRDCDAHLVAHDPDECFPAEAVAREEEVNEEKLVVNEDWDRWMPDPLEALHHTGPPWKRRIDLLSLLVGIYGSKKSFLVEYRNLLGQRLLRQLNFDTAAQMRHLELLKLRFGEADLQECEVMLKDIRDSRRVSALIADAAKVEDANAAEVAVKEHSSSYFPLEAYILSGEYWPEFHHEQFKLPEGLTPTFSQFTSYFERMKGNRTLDWMTKLGLVNVTLELGGRSVTMDVSPLQVSILHLFTLKPRWNLCDIGQQLETTTSAVRRSLQPFVQRSLIRRTSEDIETYCVCSDMRKEVVEGSEEHNESINFSVVEQEGPQDMETSPVRENAGTDPQVFWSYILGMLTNLGGMTMDRIHSTLRMFALGSNDGVECTRQHLRQFLERKINVCVSTLEAELDFAVKSSTNGKRLLDNVARTIGLREVWYFGLLYRTNDGEESWLNLDKKISAIDIKKTYPLEFDFRAKFFPEDASQELIQEITQRLFFLQVKEAILKDKLPCPPETAVLLASYACQAKYGDYDVTRFAKHPIPIDRLLSPNTLVNHDLQSQDWIRMVVRWYKEHQGMYPQTAMLHYLEIAEGLGTYGVEFFEICNRRGTDLLLGIDAMGLAVYKPPDKITPKVGFPWSEIRNIAFNDRKFTIKPIDKKSSDLVFLTKNLRVNKKILALCIGNNELYVRRRQPVPIEVQQMRSQALEENAFRELERERLAKERAARLEAERRVRELEAQLQEAERRLQRTSWTSHSQHSSEKKSSTPPTPSDSKTWAVDKVNSNYAKAASPPTPPNDLPLSSDRISRHPSLHSFSTIATFTITPTNLSSPASSFPRSPFSGGLKNSQRRRSSPGATKEPSKWRPGMKCQLPRQRLEAMGSAEAMELLESTWKETNPLSAAISGGYNNIGGENIESETRIPSPLNKEVEFPPAVVENLRSEELRQSAISRDPKLQAKLRKLHRELRPKQQLQKPQHHQHYREGRNDYTVGTPTATDTDSSVGAGEETPTVPVDKFDTIRKIRRGNTKRRVDVFEAL